MVINLLKSQLLGQVHRGLVSAFDTAVKIYCPSFGRLSYNSLAGLIGIALPPVLFINNLAQLYNRFGIVPELRLYSCSADNLSCIFFQYRPIAHIAEFIHVGTIGVETLQFL